MTILVFELIKLYISLKSHDFYLILIKICKEVNNLILIKY